jgi:hypothetical protein
MIIDQLTCPLCKFLAPPHLQYLLIFVDIVESWRRRLSRSISSDHILAMCVAKHWKLIEDLDEMNEGPAYIIAFPCIVSKIQTTPPTNIVHVILNPSEPCI